MGNRIYTTLTGTTNPTDLLTKAGGDSLYAPIGSLDVDWGNVGGTLTDQTDLVAALAAKQPLDATLTALGALSWTAGTQIPVFTDVNTVSFLTVGGSSGNILDKASADAAYQPLDAQLTSIAGLSYSGNASKVIAVNASATGFELVAGGAGGGGTWGSIAGTLSSQTDLQTALDAKQSLDATLTALAGVTTAANKLIYATGSDTFSTTDLSSVARTLLAQTSQSDMRTTGLGLGTSATVNTGTSGAAIPLLSGANTWSTTQLFNGVLLANGTTIEANNDLTLVAADDLVVLTNGASTALTIDQAQVATFVGKVVTAATATSAAGLNIPHGTAPTTPTNGDVWTTTAGMYVRVNGSTVGPLGTGGGGTTTNALTMNDGGSGVASGTTFDGSAARTISYNTIGAGGLAAANSWSANQTFTGDLILKEGATTIGTIAASSTALSITAPSTKEMLITGDSMTLDVGSGGFFLMEGATERLRTVTGGFQVLGGMQMVDLDGVTNSGTILPDGGGVNFNAPDWIQIQAANGVELLHNSSVKLGTTTTGITVTGEISNDGGLFLSSGGYDGAVELISTDLNVYASNGTLELEGNSGVNIAHNGSWKIKTNSGGAEILGKLSGTASSTSAATLNIPHGTAPTTPTNGDVWTTTAGMYVRVNGSTVGPLGTGGGGGVSDGDKGDITVSGSGATWTIDNDAVSLAKMANIATASILGRVTASTGDPEVLTGTQATTLLDTFTSSLKGLAPASGGGTSNFLRADGTWAAPTTGTVSDGDKGDVVVSSGGTVYTVESAAPSGGTFAVTGRITSSTGDVQLINSTNRLLAGGSDEFGIGNNISFASSTFKTNNTAPSSLIRIAPGSLEFYAKASMASGTTINSGAAININTTNVTFGHKLNTKATAAGEAGLNLPHGTAPSSPTNGDVWSTTSGLFAQINGSTKTIATTDTVQPLDATLTALAGASWSSGTQLLSLTAADTITLKTVGSSSGNILDKAAGDALYQPLDTQLTALAGLSYTSNAGKFIKVNATEDGFELATASGGVSDGDKGDITVASSGASWTIDNGAVSLAKMANLAANSFIGNNTGSSAAPTALSVSDAKTLLALAKGDVGLGNVDNVQQQPLDATLTALAALDSTAGLVEQTGADAFTKRAIGASSGTDILTRADGDGRYIIEDSGSVDINTANVVFHIPGTTNYYFTDLECTIPVTLYATIINASSKVTTGASTTSLASLNMPHGTAPSSPTNGDVWTTTSGMYARINGSTVGPFTSSGLTDGDKGDITVSGTGATWTIDNSAVTLAKMADVSSGTVFYRKTASAGAPETQTLATLKTDLGLTGTNSGDQTITLTGDVTGSGTGSFAATIANDTVTFAKMQNIATDRLVGRDTATSGDPEEITVGGGIEFTGSGGIQTSAFTGDVTKSAGGTATTLASNFKTRTITIIFDGGGSAITANSKFYLEIPFACTINQWTVLCDQSGSIVIDVWKDTYANYPPTVADTITASAKPTVSSATKGQSSTLTGWTTSITAGDVLGFNVDSITTCQKVTLSLKVTLT